MAGVMLRHARIATARGSLSAGDAADLLATNGQLVDVRSPADFDRDALPGAVNLPLDTVSWCYRLLKHWQPVILYGNSAVQCHRTAQSLAGEGFSRVYYLTVPCSG